VLVVDAVKESANVTMTAKYAAQNSNVFQVVALFERTGKFPQFSRTCTRMKWQAMALCGIVSERRHSEAGSSGHVMD
jgi:hypothetical protein